MDAPNQPPPDGQDGRLALASIATQLVKLLTEIIALLERLMQRAPSLALGVGEYISKLGRYLELLKEFQRALEFNLALTSSCFHSVRLVERNAAKTILQINAGPKIELSKLQNAVINFLAEAPSKGEYPGWVSIDSFQKLLRKRARHKVGETYYNNVVHAFRKKITKACGDSVDVFVFLQVDSKLGIRLGVPKWALTRLSAKDLPTGESKTRAAVC